MSRWMLLVSVGFWRVRTVGWSLAAGAAGVRLESAARLSGAADARRQSDDGGQGRTRTAPVLRHAPLRQRHAVVRELVMSRSVPSRMARAAESARQAQAAPARQHEPGERRVRRGAHLGQPDVDAARGPGAGADVRRTPGRARSRSIDDSWLERLDATMPEYQRMFAARHSRTQPRSIARATSSKALADVRARDRVRRGRLTTATTSSAMTTLSQKPAKRGEILFHSRLLSCFMCHGGVHFSGVDG